MLLIFLVVVISSLVSLQGKKQILDQLKLDTMEFLYPSWEEIERVSIEPTESTIKIGKTVPLILKIFPENAQVSTVIWTSEDPKIATVKEHGLVTGVSAGTTTIIATVYPHTIRATIHVERDILLVTREIMDQGIFQNVSPIYLSNQVDDSDGFTIVGRANDFYFHPTCHYMNMSTYLRWDFQIDLTNYSKIKYYAKKNAGHGSSRVIVSDGLHFRLGCGSLPTVEYASNWHAYNTLPTTWTEYELDITTVVGEHVVSFIGGYYDSTGSVDSSSSYSNIRFIP